MVHSGIRVDLSDIPGPKVDKHSTGGVGDKTSLILAPLAAACGLKVPMMSGRGLGHTGGTLDKLEAIPGFRVDLTLDEMRAALVRVGCAMIGQTSQIAPADKRLYALRDVSATVESIPLISASIMSKKIAEGIDALVLDVKTGSGAFMKTEADSRRLAESLVSIGNASGVRTEAIITAMDMPLGRAVGNALEVIECLDVLKGRGPADLVEVSVELTVRMLIVGGVVSDRADADRRVRAAIASGAGLERFRQIIENQGGDPKVVDDYGRLPSAPHRHLVTAPRRRRDRGTRRRAGRPGVGGARSRTGPGGGRRRSGRRHHGARQRRATRVAAGDPVLELHYRDRSRLEAALPLAEAAITIGDAAPAIRPLILGEVRGVTT